MLSDQGVDAGTEHQWAYFAWDRAFSQGTESYFLELNQKSNTTSTDGKLSVPNRTAGDVRLEIYDQGSGALSVVEVRTWSGTAWVNPQPPDAATLSVAINTSPITDYYSSPNATDRVIGTDQFIEVAIDLTAYGLNQCPVSGFTSLNLRSQTGRGNGELKDNATGTIDIPSNCAALVINKVDEQGTPVA